MLSSFALWVGKKFAGDFFRTKEDGDWAEFAPERPERGTTESFIDTSVLHCFCSLSRRKIDFVVQ